MVDLKPAYIFSSRPVLLSNGRICACFNKLGTLLLSMAASIDVIIGAISLIHSSFSSQVGKGSNSHDLVAS